MFGKKIRIFHMRVSQKVKGVLMQNLQYFIFKWIQRYWQIFKSALVYLKSFYIIHSKKLVLESLFNKVAVLKTWKFILKKCFPGNIAKFIRTPILKNICEQLLLKKSLAVNCSADLLSNFRHFTLMKPLLTAWLFPDGGRYQIETSP